MNETVDFTRAGYAALLDALCERGYEAVSYEAASPEAKHLVLRHDLDMSLDAALSTAETEAARGTMAHYFVLLRTEMYNPFSEAGLSVLRRIAELGHTVGLHFDASLYEDDSAALDLAAGNECATLESMLGKPVTIVSFHRPAASLLGRAAPVAGRRHAYEPRFFNDMGYCSDSRGAWHHGAPLDHPAVAAGRALQLLTHPLWWDRDTPLDPVTVLDKFRAQRDGVLAAALSANCDPYRDARGDTPPSFKPDTDQ